MRLAPLLFLALFAAVSIPLFAQGDTITRNPACVQLRRIWTLEGNVSDAYVGSSVGGVGDINGDGLGDFAVLSDIPWQWNVFHGDTSIISTTPVWTFDSATSEHHPIVGDFYGTGHKAIGFVRRRFVGPTGTAQRWLHLFRTDSNRLDSQPSIIWHFVSWRDSMQRALIDDFIAADIDGDGDDELIAVVRHEYGAGPYGQLWIYEGGPGFQVETPSIVIRDPEINESFYRAYAGDIDGDGRIDLMTVAQTPQQQGNSYTFYWGTGALPFANKQPDRKLTSPGFSKFIDWIDCDGDGRQDLIAPGILIWRSANGKDARGRFWDRADADIYLQSEGGQLNSGAQPGYLNSKRYEMAAGLWLPGQILFSGSSEGPDHDYDATYYPGDDGLKARIPISRPVGDVNGDGWDDAISGNKYYPDEWTKSGIAIILAGGPYIPNDEPAVGVRQIALENKTAALSLWPNPVRDELNIAWRGDLKRMPRRFEIHDMLGRRIASGDVPDGDGAAIWRSQGHPAGAFLLSVFDESGVLLVSEPFVKK